MWAVEILLPLQDRRARLLFEPHLPEGGHGYDLHLLDEVGAPVPCLPFEEQALLGHQPGVFAQTHMCVRATTDGEELYRLAQARYVELTLRGAYRQIYLKEIRITERALPFATSHPPPLASPPPGPQLPPEPPAAPAPDLAAMGCAWHQAKNFPVNAELYDVVQEPCGVDAATCCAAAKELGAGSINAFSLSGAGCCLLVRWEGASEGALGDFGWVEMGEGAGVGILV